MLCVCRLNTKLIPGSFSSGNGYYDNLMIKEIETKLNMVFVLDKACFGNHIDRANA